MKHFVYTMGSGKLQHFLCEDGSWYKPMGVVLPGTPRDPFNPAAVVMVFDSEEEAKACVEEQTRLWNERHPESLRTFHVYSSDKDVFRLLRGGSW